MRWVGESDFTSYNNTKSYDDGNIAAEIMQVISEILDEPGTSFA